MDNLKKSLTRGIINMLLPIARVLLHFDISHSEFIELSKRAYVKVAYRYFTIPKRKQTYSRVSVITGIPRKEVVRIRETNWEAPPVTKGPLNRATQVIAGWVRESEYQDTTGHPIALPLRGELLSFESLVEQYSGDITARAILDELLRVGAVEKVDKNTVRLTNQGYVPRAGETEKFEMLSNHFADLMSTGVHNITAPPKDARFQRQVAYSDIPQSIVDEFEQYSYEKSLELLIDFDRWLAQKKKTLPIQTDEELQRVGVGVYFFKHKNEQGENSEIPNKN